MDRFLHPHFLTISRKPSVPVLAFIWILGLISGLLFSYRAGTSFFSAMHTADFRCVSIIGLLSLSVLPLLFSALAVFIGQPWLLVPIAFVKAFCFSFLAFGITVAFGGAGWLIRWLLMFCDCCSLPLLWLYWLRSISHSSKHNPGGTLSCFAAALAIGCVDYCLICPILADLKF